MTEKEMKLFGDIEMCLKRISDFLGDEGFKETRKYIDRFEHDLNLLKNKENPKELLNKEEKAFLKQALKFGNYKSGTGNGIIRFIAKKGFYIYLYFSEWHSNSIYIDKREHFKGLEEEKEYSLKELGLEEV